MREHKLKTWPSVFRATLSGAKQFEYRRNDRDFAVGDVLILREWDPTPTEGYASDSSRYTGRNLHAEVTYIVHGGQFGIPEGYCVMSISRVDVRP